MKHTIVFHTINLAKKMRRAIGINLQNPSFSYSQSSALLAIDSQKEISQQEIASRLHLRPATVVSLIDELERLKLAERNPISTDRRKYNIVLTAKGRINAQKIRRETSYLENFIREKLAKKEADKFFAMVEAISNYVDQWQKAANSQLIEKEVKK